MCLQEERPWYLIPSPLAVENCFWRRSAGGHFGQVRVTRGMPASQRSCQPVQTVGQRKGPLLLQPLPGDTCRCLLQDISGERTGRPGMSRQLPALCRHAGEQEEVRAGSACGRTEILTRSEGPSRLVFELSEQPVWLSQLLRKIQMHS